MEELFEDKNIYMDALNEANSVEFGDKIEEEIEDLDEESENDTDLENRLLNIKHDEELNNLDD